jgi:hypothetical protein
VVGSKIGLARAMFEDGYKAYVERGTGAAAMTEDGRM